ncbi:hypothetical protein [Fimbriiglobus ruber]|uniref:Uncharacterized protein n=1 Tax=Fimbriiglobus ruber TaxID=1908690 RepID=A0A225DXW9_9BACT|nr:hypothetical protein [Fimbriiglobus ruber]OWK44424.1 hypothetical protein FRUB_02356 [Fimbriiglobus ruber]
MPHRSPRTSWAALLAVTILVGTVVAGLLAVGPTLSPVSAAPPGSVAAVVGGAGFVPPTPPPSAPAPLPQADPFPIQRVFVTGDRLAATLNAVARGSLVELPRDVFENRVRAAGRAVVSPPPRLAEARYRAVRTDGGLTGTAEWKIHGTGFLSLDLLGVAVSDPRWADKTPAVLTRGGSTEKPGGPVLVVPGPSESTLSFNWSARGTEAPATEQFAVAVPPAVVAFVDVDLPADRAPTVAAADQMLTGPFPGSAADRRAWRIAFGGGSRVELAVRRPDRAPPVARAGRTSTYDLAPGFAACRFEFETDPVRGQPSTAVFEADPGLRITGVTAPGQPTWRVDAGKSGSTTVHVTGIGSAPGAKVTVSGYAPLPSSPGGWHCPRLRWADAVPGRDTVEIKIDPELHFLGLDPGDYRVTNAGADAGYRATLAGTFPNAPDASQDRKAPSVRVTPAGAEFSTTEEVVWTIGDDRTDLTARFRIRVARGPLVQIPMQLSPGFVVDAVTLVPDDPGVTWSPAGQPGAILIEPTHPVAAGQTVEVAVVCRGPATAALLPDETSPAGKRHLLPFSKASVTGATDRDGKWILRVAPSLRAWPTPPPPPGDAGFVYPFRTRPPEGTVFLERRPQHVVVTTAVVVSATPQTLTATATLTIGSGGNNSNVLTLFVPAVAGGTDGGAWDMRATGGDLQPVAGGDFVPWAPALGATTAWAAVAVIGHEAALPGAIWRLKLPSPPAGEVRVEAVAHQALPADGVAPPPLALPVVAGSSPAIPTVSFAPSAAAWVARRPAPPAVVKLAPRGSPTGTAPQRGPGAGNTGWAFAELGLVTRVESGGRVSCTYSGRILEAGGPLLVLVLPGGSELLSASIAGRYVDRPFPGEGVRGEQILLPVPTSVTIGIPFEVHYRLLPVANSPFIPAALVRSPAPVPVTDPDAIRAIATTQESRPTSFTPSGGGGEAKSAWELSPEFLRWPALDAPAEPVESGPAIWVVRAPAVAALGYVLAAVVAAGGFWSLSRGRGEGYRALLVSSALLAALFGAAANWFPDGWFVVTAPPFVASLLVLTAFAARAGRAPAPAEPPGPAVVPAPRSRRGPLPSTTALGPIVALLAFVAASSRAQAPEPATVFLAAGSAPDRLTVYAPPPLLDRLDDLARGAGPAVVVTAVEYDGAADGTAPAEFTAKMSLLCDRGGDQTLTVPLTGVRLVGMDIDGQPAFPEPVRAEGYAVTVRGTGRHELTARFAVPPTASGADRDVRFSGPDVSIARVRFTAPARARQVSVPTRRGALITERGGDRTRVDADHGGGRTVTIRWREGSSDTGGATVAVREACVWDLTENGGSATAAFLFRVESGSVQRLTVEFPPGTEAGTPVVRSADVRGSILGVAAPTAPGLRDLRVGPGADGWQRVEIVFREPIDGRVLIVFHLFPQHPLGPRPLVRFPRAVGAVRENTLFGLRLTGAAADDVARAGVIDYPAEAMAKDKDFAGVPELGLDKAAPDRAFQQVAGPSPEVRPVLRPANATGGATAQVTWTVGPRADAEGAIRVDAPGTSVVEFDLPETVKLTDVWCPDLYAWNRAGARVRVWLRKPTRDVTVRWTGVLDGYANLNAKPDPATIDLPFPVARSAPQSPIAVRVRAADGWAVVPQLVPKVDPRGGGDYTADPTAAAPRFTVYAPTPADWAALVETIDRGVGDTAAYRATMAVQYRPGRPHSLTVRVTDVSAAAAPELRGPPGVEIGPVVATADVAVWRVTVPPTAPEPVILSLTARVPAASRLPEPTVTVDGPPLTWAGRSLIASDPSVGVVDGPRGWRTGTIADIAHAGGAVAADSKRPVTVWVADCPDGRWALAPIRTERPRRAPDGRPGAPTETVPAPQTETPPTHDATDSFLDTARAWAAAAAWAGGLSVVLALAVWGRRGLWPERLAGCGILGAMAIGSATPAAAVFWCVAGAGVLARLARVARRVARAVTR